MKDSTEAWIKLQEAKYTNDEYAMCTDTFENLGELLDHPDYKCVMDYLKDHMGVLEIGCNGGAFLSYIKREKYCKVWGVDLPEVVAKNPKPFMIGWDMNKGWPYIVTLVRYDLIVMLGTIEHLYNDWPVLDQIKGLLVDTGKFIVSIPTVMDQVPQHIRFHPEKEFERLLDVAGLEVIEKRKHPDYQSQQNRIFVCRVRK